MNIVKAYSDVIELNVPKEMLDYAKANAHKGSMNEYSELKGERNVDGLLAELMVHKFLPKLLHKPTTFYDLITPPGFKEVTIDVKNKYDVKRYGDRPRLDWECTIYGYEAKKVCDIYLFTSTNEFNTKIWLKGFITKNQLVTSENFYPAGSTMTTSQGTVRYRKDNYVTSVNKLGTIQSLKESFDKYLNR